MVPALFPDSLDKSFLDFFPRSPPSSSVFSFSVDAFLVESVLPAISVDESSSDPDFCSFSPVYGSPLLPGSELPPLTGAAGVIFGSAGTSEDLSSATAGGCLDSGDAVESLGTGVVYLGAVIGGTSDAGAMVLAAVGLDLASDGATGVTGAGTIGAGAGTVGATILAGSGVTTVFAFDPSSLPTELCYTVDCFATVGFPLSPPSSSSSSSILPVYTCD